MAEEIIYPDLPIFFCPICEKPFNTGKYQFLVVNSSIRLITLQNLLVIVTLGTVEVEDALGRDHVEHAMLRRRNAALNHPVRGVQRKAWSAYMVTWSQ